MNKAEELIACLEGEIAKRDARIEAQEAQIKILQSDANSWQSGYDEGRRMGAKHAAPVSEARARGVVMPAAHTPEQSKGRPFSAGWNACLNEVARLNAAPVQQVSVPDGWKLVPVNATEAILDVLYSNGMDESDSLLQDIWSAMIAAAPAAPAIGAGVTTHD